MDITNVLSIAILITEAYGLALQPRVTTFADNQNVMGISPMPTLDPFGYYREQERDVRDLVARGNKLATCGYAHKNAKSAIYCNAGYGCGWWPTNPSVSESFTFTQGAVECCPLKSGHVDFNDCELATRCIDYSTRFNTLADPVTKSGVQYCGHAAKKCATWSFVDAPIYFSRSAYSQTYTHLFCTLSHTVEFVYQDVTNSGVFRTTPASTKNALGPTAVVTEFTKPRGPSNHVSIAAAAGSAVGGTLALVLIASLATYLIWRRRKSNKTKQEDIIAQHGEVLEIDSEEQPRELQEKRACPAQLDEIEPAIYEKQALPAQLDGIEPAVYELEVHDSFHEAASTEIEEEYHAR